MFKKRICDKRPVSNERKVKRPVSTEQKENNTGVTDKSWVHRALLGLGSVFPNRYDNSRTSPLQTKVNNTVIKIMLNESGQL